MPDQVGHDEDEVGHDEDEVGHDGYCCFVGWKSLGGGKRGNSKPVAALGRMRGRGPRRRRGRDGGAKPRRVWSPALPAVQ